MVSFFNKQLKKVEKDLEQLYVDRDQCKSSDIGSYDIQINQKRTEREKLIKDLERENNKLKKKKTKVKTSKKKNKFRKTKTNFGMNFRNDDDSKEIFLSYIERAKSLDIDPKEKEFEDFLKHRDEFKRLFDFHEERMEKVFLVSQTSREIYINKLFENIVFSKNLEKKEIEEVNKIRTAIHQNQKKYFWYERSLVISGLTISCATNFDPKKISLLIDFLSEDEEGVWQRALVGLVLILCKNHQKINRYSHLINRLKELKGLKRIQEGLIKIDEILRNEYFKEVLTIEGFEKNSFFGQLSNWFLPFHQDHQMFKLAMDKADETTDIDEVSKILTEYPLDDTFKYFCSFLVSENKIEFLSKEPDSKKKNERLISITKTLNLNQSLFPYLNIINSYSIFFKFYPKDDFGKLLEPKVTIYETKLNSIILSDANKLRFEAELAYEKNRFKVSSNKLEAYIKLVGNQDKRIMRMLGSSYMQQKEYEKSIDVFIGLLEKDDKNPTYYLQLGFANYFNKAYEKAISNFELAIDNKTKDPDFVRHLIGSCYYKTRNYSIALEFFPKINDELSKKNKSILLETVKCGMFSFEFNLAQCVLDFLLKKEPHDQFLLTLQVWTFYLSRNFIEGVKLLETGLYKSSTRSKFIYGLHLYGNESFERSKEILSYFIKNKTTSFPNEKTIGIAKEAFVTFGLCCISLKELDEADKVLDLCSKLFDDNNLNFLNFCILICNNKEEEAYKITLNQFQNTDNDYYKFHFKNAIICLNNYGIPKDKIREIEKNILEQMEDKESNKFETNEEEE